MSLRPDFVTGNTRLKARLPDLAAGVGDGTAAGSGDWRDLLRAVPTAYTGQAHDVVAVLTARYDLSDTLALLRGATARAPAADRLGAVNCVGRLTTAHAIDVANARDGAAAIARLVACALPDPEVARQLPRIWERYELHADTEELETSIVAAAHRAWRVRLEPGRRRTAPVLDLLAEERDIANVVNLAQNPGANTRLLPPGRVSSRALSAVATGDWTPTLRHRPQWRPAVLRWEAHYDAAELESNLLEVRDARAWPLIRQPDPFGVEIAVGYVLAVESAARHARLRALVGQS